MLRVEIRLRFVPVKLGILFWDWNWRLKSRCHHRLGGTGSNGEMKYLENLGRTEKTGRGESWEFWALDAE